jgi:murein L,D-transpeptidase YcbB/YkuD
MHDYNNRTAQQRMLLHPVHGCAWLLACLALLLAATAGAQPVEPSSVQQLLIDRVTRIEAGETVSVEDSEIASRILLPAIYRAHDYAPLWHNPRSVEQLLAAIRASKLDGLNPSDYNLHTLEKLLQQRREGAASNDLACDLDLLLTDSLVRLGYQLSFGKVDPEALDPDWNMARYIEDMDTLVQQADAIDTGNIEALLQSLRPQAPAYAHLQAALAQYRELQARGGWQAVAPGETLKPGMSGERVAALRERLLVTADMPAGSGDPARFDAALEAGVRAFQQRHGLEDDGIVGRSTLAALNVPVGQRIDQIRANLERARWVLHDLPQTFILVDIAGFRVSYRRDGKVLWEARAVVGQPFRKTPVFRARMTYLVVNPTWTVPPTILRKDVLPAIKRDPGYLAQKNMQVIDYDGNPVDPAAIEWRRYTDRNFPYLIRQEPGPENALGRIKFMFPNKHLVYLHDTPRKSLFGKTTRAFSSGCIRIEHPFDLAELLLEDDPDWNKEKLLATVASLETRTIRLRQPVSIILLYWTVDFTPDGRVIFRQDIYERDPAIIRGLNAGFKFRDSAIIRDHLQSGIPPAAGQDISL